MLLSNDQSLRLTFSRIIIVLGMTFCSEHAGKIGSPKSIEQEMGRGSSAASTVEMGRTQDPKKQMKKTQEEKKAKVAPKAKVLKAGPKAKKVKAPSYKKVDISDLPNASYEDQCMHFTEVDGTALLLNCSEIWDVQHKTKVSSMMLHARR